MDKIGEQAVGAAAQGLYKGAGVVAGYSTIPEYRQSEKRIRAGLIFEENTLSVIKFFNRVGGAREFVAIFDDFFKSELEKISQT